MDRLFLLISVKILAGVSSFALHIIKIFEFSMSVPTVCFNDSYSYLSCCINPYVPGGYNFMRNFKPLNRTRG
jgi:hypothetical protein